MGKRILSQRRGRGGMQYRSSKKNRVAPTKYLNSPLSEIRSGTVTRIFHERGRSAPLAQITFDDRKVSYQPAVVGLYKDMKITMGSNAEPKIGNILPLDKIPEGTNINNIENKVGDGGKLIRASGCAAILFSKMPNGVVVKFPSGYMVTLNPKCRATIGEVAGGGRLEKPLLKAGTKYHAMKAKGKLYPRVRSMAMAAVHHPFGGGRHQHSIHKSTCTSKTAPPGAKVGNIGARKTGRKRIKRIKVIG